MDRFNDFSKHVKKNGIIIDSGLQITESLDEDGIKSYLKLLSIFHDRAKGFDNYMIQKLPNKTGELLSQYKIMDRRIKREVAKSKRKKQIDCCEEFIIEKSVEMLERSRSALLYITFDQYLKVLDRSMKRKEISIGSNKMEVIKENEPLIVKSISECFYDVNENDFIRMAVRLKRKSCEVPWRDLLESFLEYEKLGDESRYYLRACLSYPYEFMKNAWRYYQAKREWTPERYLVKMRRAYSIDDKSII